MADVPLAYFLTFHTYGTWLHGAPEGSVDWAHHTYGERFAPANAERQTAMRQRMCSAPITLAPPQRQGVHESCQETCRYRRWELHALHVRTTHVHVIVTAAVPPERVLNDLKLYATRRLRQLHLMAPEARVWSRHGSTRYLWEEERVCQAIVYVLHEQGVPLEPVAFVSDEFRYLQRPP